MIGDRPTYCNETETGHVHSESCYVRNAYTDAVVTSNILYLDDQAAEKPKPKCICNRRHGRRTCPAHPFLKSS